jgi:8-oxo-dGTP pyrophosphatase MutT (NUDIX family)
MKPMIGCITMIQHNDRIVAIQCKKGRGVIMPGGKWQPGETFIDTAKRELEEETGLKARNFKLIFHGMSEEGYYTYAFSAQIDEFKPTDSAEGDVVLTDWHTLKQSKFGGFYQLMEMSCTVAK